MWDLLLAYFSDLTASNSFLGPVFILDVPLAAETYRKKPTKPDMPKIAAKESKLKENIELIKSK